MLYLVATPIGNLEDITYRAIRILGLCDYILCEDTKTSRILLEHYQITTPMQPYHKFNEKSSLDTIIEDLKKGKEIALISDGGTPLFSDPGHLLVRSCIEKKLPFTCLPGACSLLPALLLSGFYAIPFIFLGFLPKKEKQREAVIKKMLFFPGTALCFETPHRLLSTLEAFHRVAPKSQLAIAREMTKKYEECVRGTAEELLTHFSQKKPKGECILLTEAKSEIGVSLSPIELITNLQELFGLDIKEAIQWAAKITKSPKKLLYDHMLTKDKSHVCHLHRSCC